jgi:hypothetical protein
VVARERFREGDLRLLLCARFVSREAFRRVAFDPVLGGGSFTPARRALDKPIAIACRADRAPCLPWRTCSISSRTNSPACVEGALPSRSASWARSRVSSSGIVIIVRFSYRKWSCFRSHSYPPFLSLDPMFGVHTVCTTSMPYLAIHTNQVQVATHSASVRHFARS